MTELSQVSGLFQVLDAGAPGDRVAGRRREVKFAIPRADAGKLRGILEVNCRRIIHRGPVSLVSSIYFDDELLSGCRENLAGVGRRHKLRLRWYDNRQDRFYLEVKTRENQLISKERIALACDESPFRFHYSVIRDNLRAILPERPRLLMDSRPEPVALIRYRREHFRLPGSAVRATLDTQVECIDQSGALRPRTTNGVSIGDLVILEVKIPMGQEEDVAHVFWPLKLRMTRSSKYVESCLLIGGATGASILGS